MIMCSPGWPSSASQSTVLNYLKLIKKQYMIYFHQIRNTKVSHRMCFLVSVVWIHQLWFISKEKLSNLLCDASLKEGHWCSCLWLDALLTSFICSCVPSELCSLIMMSLTLRFMHDWGLNLATHCANTWPFWLYLFSTPHCGFSSCILTFLMQVMLMNVYGFVSVSLIIFDHLKHFTL